MGRGEVTEQFLSAADVGCSSYALIVQGFTDHTGSKQTNDKLSSERADAVVSYELRRRAAHAHDLRGHGPVEPHG